MKTFNDRRLDPVTEQMITGNKEEVQEVSKQEVSKQEDTEEVIFKKPESKTKRMNILIKPSLYERMRKRADREYISVNEQINQYVEEMIEKKGY